MHIDVDKLIEVHEESDKKDVYHHTEMSTYKVYTQGLITELSELVAFTDIEHPCRVLLLFKCFFLLLQF